MKTMTLQSRLWKIGNTIQTLLTTICGIFGVHPMQFILFYGKEICGFCAFLLSLFSCRFGAGSGCAAGKYPADRQSIAQGTFLRGYQSVKTLESDYAETLKRMRRFCNLYSYARLILCSRLVFSLIYATFWTLK